MTQATQLRALQLHEAAAVLAPLALGERLNPRVTTSMAKRAGMNRLSRGLELAIKAAGSKAALADLLNIRPQSISQWTTIPAGRVVTLERLTGIPRAMLRPDLYS